MVVYDKIFICNTLVSVFVDISFAVVIEEVGTTVPQAAAALSIPASMLPVFALLYWIQNWFYGVLHQVELGRVVVFVVDKDEDSGTKP